ncbi:ferrochelatase [Litorivicinus lipolyticus]|uniref:Ferrochelatase n=1 Tax=Litorivicinus lipolyticus TaxID=418701 RepID=A0A5Q2QD19_9GAMM|nr:ferrochelatase [Litorivicinus lipolyticus]QGG81024.1 ferrochelatase [Litorivicinus lipolyticus]
MSHLPAEHPAVKPPRVGVLLVNLGTPDATDYWSMRRYLSEFLSDRRVIELSPLLWQPILQGIILSLRPQKSGKAYDSIWNRELDESPLRTITRNQSDALAAHAAAHWPNVQVEWAMRYGNPSIAVGMDALAGGGCDRILVVPLYPQYSAATTATVNDKVFEWLQKQRWQPAVRTLPQYHDHPAYVNAIAQSIRDHVAGLDWTPDLLMTSFHGVPKEYLDKGDPYHCFCAKSGRLIREALDWPADQYQQTFQSRFGPKEWLQPYTDVSIEAAAKRGVKNMLIAAPGFSADCLETLEELAIEGAEIFKHHGGENFAFVPCLNDSALGTAMINQLVGEELAGWV